MGPFSGESDAALIGRTLLGRYQILRRLSRGVSSELYLATERATERQLAVKVLRTSVVFDEEISERFRREAQLLVRLQHPCIVATHACGELPWGALFIVMDFVDGTRLDAALAAGALSVAASLEIGLQCADGLAYAHAQGVVHRDFKPANVMLAHTAAGDAVKILDFGAARIAEMEELTPVGSIVGTLGYLSPEQCLGEVATPASDQYALGLVLYELLSGQKAIVGNSPLDFLQLHEHQRIPALSTLLASEHAESVSGVVMRMLAVEPEARFIALAQARAALQGLLARVKPQRRNGC